MIVYPTRQESINLFSIGVETRHNKGTGKKRELRERRKERGEGDDVNIPWMEGRNNRCMQIQGGEED